MNIGLKEISQLSDVSLGTASDILNRGRRHLYSDGTIKRVLSVAQQKGYRANRFAQAMRSRKSGIVGFAAANCTPDGVLDNYNIYPFQVGLNKRLAVAGYHVGIVELAELDRTNPDVPFGLQELFYGALVVHYGLSPRAMDFARHLGIPLVWWDSGVFEPGGCLYRDEIRASRDLTGHLIGLGHVRIAYMVGQSGWQTYQTGAPAHYSYAQRYESYRATLKRHGLTEMPVVGYDPESLATQLAGYDATALIIQGTNLSMLHEPLARLGWRIGRHLSVATLDREARIRQSGPVVGGMLYDRFAAGEAAAEMVLASLAEPGQQVPSVVLKAQFDVGQTIAKVCKQHKRR